MMHNPHRPIPQPRTELPGITPAVRSQWQSIGNAGLVCQVLAWALCWYTAGFEDRSFRGVAVLIALAGLCALLAELYGRLRYRRRQMSFPQGYSLCRYPGFLLAAAAVFVQRYTGETMGALLLLCAGVILFWTSLLMEKAQRRRWRAQRELEEI